MMDPFSPSSTPAFAKALTTAAMADAEWAEDPLVFSGVTGATAMTPIAGKIAPRAGKMTPRAGKTPRAEKMLQTNPLPHIMIVVGVIIIGCVLAASH
jgi:hypothetical protein